MPIKSNFRTTAHEFDVTDAFVVIERVTTHLDVPEPYHSVELAIYKSKAAKANGKPPLERQSLRRDFEPGQGFAPARFYDWLKTLPEFAAATDEAEEAPAPAPAPAQA